jgi:type III secretion protein S
MNSSDVTGYIMQALYLTLMLSLPTILVASIIGTLFALLQALTQIQEQTLSFAIKLIAVAITLYLTASWMGGELINFTTNVFGSFPRTAR